MAEEISKVMPIFGVLLEFQKIKSRSPIYLKSMILINHFISISLYANITVYKYTIGELKIIALFSDSDVHDNE